MKTVKAGAQSWVWGPYSRLGLCVVIATFVFDQATKWWMLNVFHLAEKGRVAIAPFFDLVLVKNRGISYGLFKLDTFSGQILLATIALVAGLALWVWLARGATTRLMAVSIALIIGGALGNAVDRVLLGGVADFISLHAYGFYWYVFNIADMALVAGVVGLLYDSMLASRNDAA